MCNVANSSLPSYFRDFPAFFKGYYLRWFIRLDQINLSKSKRTLKYVCAESPSGWDNCRLPSLQCMKTPKSQNGPLQATYKGLASCQTQTFKNCETGLWVEWCYAPSTLTLGLFWFVCVNKNEKSFFPMKACHIITPGKIQTWLLRTAMWLSFTKSDCKEMCELIRAVV